MVKISTFKTIIGLNIPYFLEHKEEIINNTEVLLPQQPFGELRFSDNEEYRFYYDLLEKKHLQESGNWYAFGRAKTYVHKGESEEVAFSRIAQEYCKATGHWDLFRWKEISMNEIIIDDSEQKKEVKQMIKELQDEFI